MSDATPSDIQVTRLPNGLTVVTEGMDRVETVSFGAYVASGTRNETKAENGASHFLEHMAFKGTARRTAMDIAVEVENVGGLINAYTAREQTAYYIKLLKEDLPLGADIIGDILTHSTFAPEELERERGVILQEIGQANDTPDDIIFDRFQETAYPDQPMGRPTLGTEKGIKGMKRASLTKYMQRNYAAGNIVIAAAGALQHDAVVDLARQHFADLPAAMPPPSPAAPTPAASSARAATSTRSTSSSASPPSPTTTPTTTRPSSSAPCSAAACPPACSRKSVRSAASSIPSTPSPPPFSTAACLASTPAPARPRPRNSSPSPSKNSATSSTASPRRNSTAPAPR